MFIHPEYGLLLIEQLTLSVDAKTLSKCLCKLTHFLSMCMVYFFFPFLSLNVEGQILHYQVKYDNLNFELASPKDTQKKKII